jgi:hypothetical protein
LRFTEVQLKLALILAAAILTNFGKKLVQKPGSSKNEPQRVRPEQKVGPPLDGYHFLSAAAAISFRNNYCTGAASEIHPLRTRDALSKMNLPFGFNGRHIFHSHFKRNKI